MCDNLYDRVHCEAMHDYDPRELDDDRPSSAELAEAQDRYRKWVSRETREAVERIMKEAERYGF